MAAADTWKSRGESKGLSRSAVPHGAPAGWDLLWHRALQSQAPVSPVLERRWGRVVALRSPTGGTDGSCPPPQPCLWPVGRVSPRRLSPAAGHWVSGAVGLGALLPWLVLPSWLPGSIGEEPPASSHVLGPCRDPEQETNDLLRMRCLHSASSAQMKLKY